MIFRFLPEWWSLAQEVPVNQAHRQIHLAPACPDMWSTQKDITINQFMEHQEK